MNPVSTDPVVIKGQIQRLISGVLGDPDNPVPDKNAAAQLATLLALYYLVLTN